MLKHVQLDDTADFDFEELRAAGAKVGATDPLPALEDVDCDPADIRLQVEDFSEHTGVLNETLDEVKQVLTMIGEFWQVDDGPDPNYLAAVAEVNRRYAAITERMTATTTAGNQTADELDQMAKDVANDAEDVIDSTSEATALVLYGVAPDGTKPDDDTKTAATRTVQDACTDIDTLSTNATDGIPAMQGPSRLANVKAEYDD